MQICSDKQVKASIGKLFLKVVDKRFAHDNKLRQTSVGRQSNSLAMAYQAQTQ